VKYSNTSDCSVGSSASCVDDVRDVNYSSEIAVYLDNIDSQTKAAVGMTEKRS